MPSHQVSVAPQAKELVKTNEWVAGDIETALTTVFLRIDELLLDEDNRQELQLLVGADEGIGRYVYALALLTKLMPWSLTHLLNLGIIEFGRGKDVQFLMRSLGHEATQQRCTVEFLAGVQICMDWSGGVSRWIAGGI